MIRSYDRGLGSVGNILFFEFWFGYIYVYFFVCIFYLVIIYMKVNYVRGKLVNGSRFRNIRL